MRIPQISRQILELSDTLRNTNALTNHLSRLNYQPGVEALDETDAVRLELTQDIHDGLRQLEEELELLQQDVESSNSGRFNRKRENERDSERERLTAQVSRLVEDLKRARSHFRRSQLIAKRASEAAKQKERELTFASIQSTPTVEEPGDTENPTDRLFANRKRPQQNQLSKDDALVAASSDVTAALRRTHNLLSTELSRSRFAQETFNESTAALAELGEHYNNLDSILSSSRNLLGTLLRSQKSDTWYLETAFYILLVTLGWLFFRRILFGPFVKLPLFLWNTIFFLSNWLLWKPIYLFLTITGVITKVPVTSTRLRQATSSESRPPLIVHPSAQGLPQAMTPQDQERLRNSGGVPAGGGGMGAKSGPDGQLRGEMSERIARMAQDSEKEQGQTKDEEEKELPRRGDGTLLKERGDIPKNPRKKAFDTEEEAKKMQRDEL